MVQFDVTFDEPTQRQQADLAKDGISEIRLVTVWLPLIGLLLGLIFIAPAASCCAPGRVATRRPPARTTRRCRSARPARGRHGGGGRPAPSG